jgi:hypothetical protein
MGREKADSNVLDSPVIHGLTAQLVSGNGIGKIHHQTIRAGEHLGLRRHVLAGFNLNLNRGLIAENLNPAD